MNNGMLPADQIVAISGIVGLIIALLTLIATWKMYTKANEKGWKVLIPIYGTYIGFKIASFTNGFWNIIITEVFAVIITAVSASAGIAIVMLGCSVINVIVLLVIYAKQCGRLAKVFGRSKGFAWLCFFLPPIAIMILGFNSNIRYINIKEEEEQKQNSPNPVDFGTTSKSDVINMIMSQRTPSEQFISGAVFDISRQNRAAFISALRSTNALQLQQLFIEAYSAFKEHPEAVGSTPQMINKNLDDTNPFRWNSDCFELPSGDYAALLYMPVQNDKLAARIAGIIFSDKDDGYYYCMLDSNENTSSTVYRNKGFDGIESVGEVRGRGFELVDSFLQCIRNNFSKDSVRDENNGGTVSVNKAVIQSDGREKAVESDAFCGKSGKRYSAGKMIYSNYTAAVYELVGEPDHVLKVYSSEYLIGEREQEKKILAMISNPVAAENIAWPTDAVYSGGAFIGYCMNKVVCSDNLSEVKSLAERELIGKKRIVAAYNLCEVVKDIHSEGHVFGDMDPFNIWINTENCFISLTETDNYHIFDRDNGTIYRCCTANSAYTAPEIMERAKNGIAVKDMPLSVFTRDTDYYALAVHIFRLVMKGYFPFDSHGTPKFPFADSYVTAPAGAHDYQSLPESVKALFRRAFCDREFRPNPDEWQSALQEMLR